MNNEFLSPAKIIKLVILSLVIGFTIVIVAIMPAEYGIDPTGAGKLLGFDKLYVSGEKAEAPVKEEASQLKMKILKMENAGVPETVATPKQVFDPAPSKQLAEREDEIEIIVPAGKGLEYKVKMLKYGKMKYEWLCDQTLFFDFHGEVDGDTVRKFYESYTVAYSKNMVGIFTAPFKGPQGWYFRNLTDKDAVVKLKLKGQYLLKK
jgi:hypothetical protein